MTQPDVTPHRTGFWSFSRRKPDPKGPITDVEKPRPNKRTSLSLQTHLVITPRAPTLSDEQARTPKDALSPRENHRLRAGPEYAPTISISPEVVAQSPPANVSQAVTIVNKAPDPRKGRQLRAPARLLCKLKRVDSLKDIKADIHQTGQLIRAKAWAPRPGSSLSLGEMAVAGNLSWESKLLLEAAAGEFREFKRGEQEKRLREEKEREERAKVEEEMEVVDTVLVRRGPVLRRVQRLQPASMKALGTLDPYAAQSASMRCASTSVNPGVSSSSSIAGSSTAPVMERGRGVERRPRDLAIRPRNPQERRPESSDGSW